MISTHNPLNLSWLVVIALALSAQMVMGAPRPLTLQERKAELQAIYRQLNAVQWSDAHQAAHLKATVKNRHHKSPTRQELALNMTVSATHTRWVTDQAEMYRDEKEAVLVVHDQKTVYLSDLPTEDVQTPMQDMINKQNLLFDLSEPVRCETIEKDGRIITRLELHPTAKGRELLLIRKAFFEYDAEAGTLLSTKLLFLPAYPLAESEINYETMDLNYQGPDLDKKANSYVFTRGGKLRAAYAQYQIIDNRTSK